MSDIKTWNNMNNEEKNQFNNDEEKYKQYVQEGLRKEKDIRNKQKKPQLEKEEEHKKILSVDDLNIIERQKYEEKGESFIYLKPNQRIFNFKFGEIDEDWTEGSINDFNKVLSQDNKMKAPKDFAKTDDPQVVKRVFSTIFSDEKARISLKYLCTFSLGGKYKDDRKNMNKIIQQCLKTADIWPYGEENLCGYNGLLKMAPIFLSDIRRSTLPDKEHPKDKTLGLTINHYAPGFESNFEYSALLLMGCNQASINYCYTRLLLSIDLIDKKRYKSPQDLNLIKRLATFILPYAASAHITEKESNKILFTKIKDMDLKGSEINFDQFGYQ